MSRQDIEAAVAQLSPDELRSFLAWVDDYRDRVLESSTGAPTAYELGQDIWGSMSGPDDASVNPHYMEGFGERSLT